MRASELAEIMRGVAQDHGDPVLAAQTANGYEDIQGWALIHGQAVLQTTERPF